MTSIKRVSRVDRLETFLPYSIELCDWAFLPCLKVLLNYLAHASDYTMVSSDLLGYLTKARQNNGHSQKDYAQHCKKLCPSNTLTLEQNVENL